MHVNRSSGEHPAPEPDELAREAEAFLRKHATALTLGDQLALLDPEIPEHDGDIGAYDPEERPEDVEPGRVRYVDVDLPDMAAEAADADPTGNIQVTRQEQGSGKPTPRAKFRKPRKPRTPRERAVRDRRDDLKPFPYGSKEE